MSDVDDMSCEEFAEGEAELALGVLTGRERAAALGHLDRCEACRTTVGQLSLVGEELLGLLPGIEPPAGFETRVLDRIGVAASPPVTTPPAGPVPAASPPAGRGGVTRRTLAVAAVSVAVLGAALGGWGIRAATVHPDGPSLTAAALLTAGRQPVGKVFLYYASPRWVYMSVHLGPGTTGPVICELVGKNGRVTDIGTFRTHDGYGAWGSPDPVAGGSVTGARLVSADGTVLATASFS